jgi:nitroreductase
MKMSENLGVSEALRQRRSVRWFDPEWRMSEQEFTHMMQHVVLSPTANNIQNWRFIRVTDRAQRKAIRALALDQAQVSDASELVVFCYDEKAWQEKPERYWTNAPKEVAEMVLGNFPPYFNQPGIERDEGLRSCGMAAMSMMLLAKEMGYDSCPMTGFYFDSVADVLKLPPHHHIAMMVAIGKKVKEPWQRPGQLPLSEVVMENCFSTE